MKLSFKNLVSSSMVCMLFSTANGIAAAPGEKERDLQFDDVMMRAAPAWVQDKLPEQALSAFKQKNDLKPNQTQIPR